MRKWKGIEAYQDARLITGSNLNQGNTTQLFPQSIMPNQAILDYTSHTLSLKNSEHNEW